MATSGTHTFTLDLSDIMEEAYDLCGLELRSGYSYRSAKRALNLVFLEWQNKGLNLWTVEQGTVTLSSGTNTYSLDSSAIEVIDAFIRTDAGNVDKQFDQRLNRISRTEYNHQANKLNKSTPDAAETYTLVYDYIQKIEDAGTIASNNADVPSRYLPCLTYALAYNLATKNPEALQRVPLIKQRYEELWNEVSDADRERAPIRFVPDLATYR